MPEEHENPAALVDQLRGALVEAADMLLAEQAKTEALTRRIAALEAYGDPGELKTRLDTLERSSAAAAREHRDTMGALKTALRRADEKASRFERDALELERIKRAAK